MRKVILAIITAFASAQVMLASLMITRMVTTEIILSVACLIWVILFFTANNVKLNRNAEQDKLHKKRV